jgi:sulfur carrier protein
MRVTVNGQPHDLPEGATLAALVTALDLTGQRIAFEVNGAIVPRSQRDAHPLQPGDRVEVVTAIGGG